MKRGFFAAGFFGWVSLLAAAGQAWGEDLVTLSGATYRDVRAVRVEPDGVTWRYDGGAVKVDFTDCPEHVRRAYHYDPEKATAYRDARTRAHLQADEQSQRDAREHETRQRARAQAAVAQMTAADAGTSAVFRRALSPAASNATREMAAQMQAEADKRAAADALNPDQLHLFPDLPSALGPRPINPMMTTPNSAEFRANLSSSPTGASSTFVPVSEFFDPAKSSLNSGFFIPNYMTKSYYVDTDRAEAFARGVPLKP